jgi:hypothetical protein
MARKAPIMLEEGIDIARVAAGEAQKLVVGAVRNSIGLL